MQQGLIEDPNSLTNAMDSLEEQREVGGWRVTVADPRGLSGKNPTMLYKNRGIYAQIFFCAALVYLDVSESFCIVILKNITSKKNLFCMVTPDRTQVEK